MEYLHNYSYSKLQNYWSCGLQLAWDNDYKYNPSVFDGCPSGTDSRWNITWANTEQNATDTQHCPGGAKIKGNSDL